MASVSRTMAATRAVSSRRAGAARRRAKRARAAATASSKPVRPATTATLGAATVARRAVKRSIRTTTAKPRARPASCAATARSKRTSSATTAIVSRGRCSFAATHRARLDCVSDGLPKVATASRSGEVATGTPWHDGCNASCGALSRLKVGAAAMRNVQRVVESPNLLRGKTSTRRMRRDAPR